MIENFNYLSSNGFKLVIDNDKFENIEYNILQCPLPSVTMNSTPANFRNENGFVPGDTIEFDPLVVKFIVNENMNDYFSILQWFLDARVSNEPLVHDLLLHIYSNKNNLLNKIQFVRAFPTSLTDLVFESNVSNVEYLTANVTFVYDYYQKI